MTSCVPSVCWPLSAKSQVNIGQVCKIFFSRFISLSFLMITENMEVGGDCGRDRRHWDGISLHSKVCYLCLAHQQHLLVRDTAFSDRKLQFPANSQYPWGKMEDIYLWQAIKNMHKVCLGQPNMFYWIKLLHISLKNLKNSSLPKHKKLLKDSYRQLLLVSSFSSLILSSLTVEAGCQHTMSEFSRNIRTGKYFNPI